MSAMLSKRVQHLIKQKEPKFMISLDKLNAQIKIDGEKDGAPRPIFLDVAVNKLVTDLVNQKLQSEDIYATESDCEYYDESGTPKFKKAAADYFTKYFHSATPVSPDNLCMVSSARACMDLLAHCIAEPGDVFLAFTPTYCQVPISFGARSQVEIWPAPLKCQDGHSAMSFHLSVEKIEKSYEAAIKAKKTVKGIFLINPGNPIGDIMPVELLMEILQFAAQRQLHVVVDEIYALFHHASGANFRSVLSLPNLPDPQRTHMMYGMSKDFGLATWRVGIIYSLNAPLIKMLRGLAGSQCLPLQIMEAATRLLNDHGWVDRLVDIMPKRAARNYRYASDRLKKMDLLVRDTAATFFIWFYMGTVMKEVTFEEEIAMAQDLQNRENLYIAPGQDFLSSDPGWFRMIFTVPAEDLVEGMNRLERYIEKLKHKKTEKTSYGI